MKKTINYRNRYISFFIALLFMGVMYTNESDSEIVLDASQDGGIVENYILNPTCKNGFSGWSAETGMALSLDASDESIVLSGTQDEKWNYAHVSLKDNCFKPGGLYRLEAEVKVSSISDPAFLPLLSVYILNEEGVKIANYNTINYKISQLERWQKLFVEFIADSGSKSGYVKIKKTTTNSISAKLNIRGISVQQIDALGIADRVSNANQLSIGTIHPRLFLTQEKIDLIKSKLDQYPYSKFWNRVKNNADTYIGETPPVSAENYTDSSIRKLGNKLPYIALAYVITNDKKYFNGAKKWMDGICSYEKWASDGDLGAAHLLEGMSLAYDWLYNDLTVDEREIYKQKITHHAEIFYNGLINQSFYWAHYYLDNHNYVNVMALSLAGVALYGDQQDAESWLFAAKDNFNNVLTSLSPDGASHEGIAYWAYGTGALLKYFLACESFWGLDDIKESPFFNNTVKFRLYSSLPDYKDNVDLGDSPRWDFSGPGNSLRALASIFKNGYAQWLAEEIDNARGDTAKILWSDLIWYDESVKMNPPTDLPRSAYFDNIGIAIDRSDWSSNAIWAFFKAGPPMGHWAETNGLWLDSGHMDPDAGTFLLWAYGNWVIIDDGYVNLNRTKNHNVMLFNQKGQVGDGKIFFDTFAAKEKRPTSSIVYNDIQTDCSYFVALLHNMYPKEIGIEKWERHYIFFQKGIIVVKDYVESANAVVAENLIHFAKGSIQDGGKDQVYYNNKNTWLSINELSQKVSAKNIVKYSIAEKERSGDGGSNNEGLLLNIATNGSGQFSNTKILCLARSKEELANLKYNEAQNSNKLHIVFNNFSAEIDFSLKEIKLK